MRASQLAGLKLPPEAPLGLRARIYVLKFLVHHNRLDGYMAFMALLWGTITLAFPGFWGAWPVTFKLAALTGGHPEVVSWSLLVAGLGSYTARAFRWARARSFFALIAFSNWAMLAVVFLSVDPIFSPGVAVYGGLAFAKLLSYVAFVVENDQAKHQARREAAPGVGD